MFLAEANGVKQQWNPENAAIFPFPSIEKLLR
jgi:hypothetical protein